MKFFYITGILLAISCNGCLDLTIDLPVSDFKLSKTESESQIREAINDYLLKNNSVPCTNELIGFLLNTSIPIGPNFILPNKVRSDSVLQIEYAPKEDTCPNVDASRFILDDLLGSRRKIVKFFRIEPNSELSDCQKKFSDPKKVRLQSLSLESTENTFNIDFPAGRLYYATKDMSLEILQQKGIAALISDGTLAQFAHFDALPKGPDNLIELPIDDDKKPIISEKFLAQDITIVIETDDFKFKEENEGRHSYLMLPTGEINLKISATVVVRFDAEDLNCLSEIPES